MRPDESLELVVVDVIWWLRGEVSWVFFSVVVVVVVMAIGVGIGERGEHTRRPLRDAALVKSLAILH